MNHLKSHLLKPHTLQLRSAVSSWVAARSKLTDSLRLEKLNSRFAHATSFSQESVDSKQRSIARLSPNQLINGRLSKTDSLNRQRRDRFADEYWLSGLTIGQQVRIQLSSQDFDAYLQLVNAKTGRLLQQNDDQTLLVKNSSLAFTIQAGIEYRVRVTSYDPREVGRYTLSARSSNSTAQSFDRDFGYGLVDAAKAVANAIGADPFADAADFGQRWQLNLVKAPEAWAQGFTGQGVTVAVLDTGVDYRHPDLQANLWQNLGEVADNGLDDDGNGFVDDLRGWSFVDSDSNNPMDADQHGTHIAGTIAAVNNGFGITGVAHSAKIMPVRVIDGTDDRYPERFDANVAAGIRYAVQNGARVLNLSLGNFLGDPPMVQTKAALQEAQRAGVIAVMASGNEREDGANRPIEPAYLARNGLGIAVGAVNRRRQVADFSNPAGNRRLNFVVAPGTDVYSTIPQGQYSGGWNGTSMATAYVSGVIALMLSANPSLTPTQVVTILRKTASIEGAVSG